MQLTDGVGLTWFIETGSLVSKASSFRITLANFSLFAMESSIEWRTLLEEIELEFLDSSLEGSYCKVLSAKSS